MRVLFPQVLAGAGLALFLLSACTEQGVIEGQVSNERTKGVPEPVTGETTGEEPQATSAETPSTVEASANYRSGEPASVAITGAQVELSALALNADARVKAKRLATGDPLYAAWEALEVGEPLTRPILVTVGSEADLSRRQLRDDLKVGLDIGSEAQVFLVVTATGAYVVSPNDLDTLAQGSGRQVGIRSREPAAIYAAIAPATAASLEQRGVVEPYQAPPRRPRGLEADVNGPTSVVLTWEMRPAWAQRLRLVYRPAGESIAIGCQASDMQPIELNEDNAWVVDGLEPATTYAFHLCSENGRAPPDVSVAAVSTARTPPANASVGGNPDRTASGGVDTPGAAAALGDMGAGTQAGGGTVASPGVVSSGNDGTGGGASPPGEPVPDSLGAAEGLADADGAVAGAAADATGDPGSAPDEAPDSADPTDAEGDATGVASGAESVALDDPIPQTLTLVGETGFTGAAGETIPLTVRVDDQHGEPLAGAPVAGLTGDPNAVTTDAEGLATLLWTLPTTPGVTSVELMVGDGEPRLNATATVTAGAPARLVSTTTEPVIGVAGSTVNVTLRVEDQYGNGVADVLVVDASAPSTASGAVATVVNLATTAGEQQLSLSLVDYPGVTLSLTANVQPDVPAALTALAGDGQSASVGSTLDDSLVVRLTDAHGNGVADETVVWATNDGSLAAAGVTDANGEASAAWQLGTAAGAQVASASWGALTPVDFGATALAGEPATLSVVAGDGQSAPAGTDVPTDPQVRLLDAHSNPVAGEEISLTASAGLLSAANITTDADGYASVGWTLGAPGAHTLTLTNAASGLSTTLGATAQATLQISGPETLGLMTGSATSVSYAISGGVSPYTVTLASAPTSATGTIDNAGTFSVASPSAVNDDGSYIISVTDSGYESATLEVTVTVIDRLTCIWTGAVDDDWANAGNWSVCDGGVPDATSLVTIDGTAPESPLVSGSTSIYGFGRHGPGGGTVRLGDAVTLTLTGAPVSSDVTWTPENPGCSDCLVDALEPLTIDNDATLTLADAVRVRFSGYNENLEVGSATETGHLVTTSEGTTPDRWPMVEPDDIDASSRGTIHIQGPASSARSSVTIDGLRTRTVTGLRVDQHAHVVTMDRVRGLAQAGYMARELFEIMSSDHLISDATWDDIIIDGLYQQAVRQRNQALSQPVTISGGGNNWTEVNQPGSGNTFTFANSTATTCTWTGAVSTTWRDSANWSCGVDNGRGGYPSYPDSAVIPGSPASGRLPQLSGALGLSDLSGSGGELTLVETAARTVLNLETLSGTLTLRGSDGCDTCVTVMYQPRLEAGADLTLGRDIGFGLRKFAPHLDVGNGGAAAWRTDAAHLEPTHWPRLMLADSGNFANPANAIISVVGALGNPAVIDLNGLTIETPTGNTDAYFAFGAYTTIERFDNVRQTHAADFSTGGVFDFADCSGLTVNDTTWTGLELGFGFDGADAAAYTLRYDAGTCGAAPAMTLQGTGVGFDASRSNDGGSVTWQWYWSNSTAVKAPASGAGNPVYLDPGVNATASGSSLVAYAAPAAGTLSDLSITYDGFSGASGDSWTAVVVVDGVDSGLSVTFTQGGATPHVDSVGSVAVTAGQEVSIRLDPLSTATQELDNVTATVDVVPD